MSGENCADTPLEPHSTEQDDTIILFVLIVLAAAIVILTVYGVFRGRKVKNASSVSAVSSTFAELVNVQTHERVCLCKEVTTIGRDEQCDIALLDDDSVSRGVHAIFKYQQRVLKIFDSGSTNGIKVNGQMVNGDELRHGDTIQLGETKFRVEIKR